MSSEKESLIKYPCNFPIKVMGASRADFQSTIAELIRSFDADFDPNTIQSKPSSSGNYTGLTVTVRVHSQAQLDDIYRALSGHEMVSVVL